MQSTARTAIGLALLLAFASGAAAQDERPDVLGTWLVREETPAGTATGQLRFELDADGGYRTTRTVFDPEQGIVVRRGSAWLVGRRLLLRERWTERGDHDYRGMVRALGGFGPGALIAPPRVVTRLALVELSGARAEGSVREGGRAWGELELWRMPASTGNRVRLLVDGPQAYPAMHAAIAAARRTISMQTFSWSDDDAGRAIADALVAAARRGVKVRVLVDGYPVDDGRGWKIGDRLRAGGVELVIHHQFRPALKRAIGSAALDLSYLVVGGGVGAVVARRLAPSAGESRGVLNHDHRKLIVVDGRVALLGGMNIGSHYATGRWHDVHCEVEGPAVRRLESLFFDRWHTAGGRGEPDPDPITRRPDWRPGALEVEVAENLPGVRHEIAERYLEEIRRAERTIFIENPYLLDDRIRTELIRAVRRGVRTVVILPDHRHNDEDMLVDAFKWVQNDLIRARVELHFYQGRMSHGKVAVFDGRVATIGSSNLDAQSLVHNAELNVFVEDPGFAREVERRVFEVDLARSERAKSLDMNWKEKLRSGVLHLIRGWL